MDTLSDLFQGKKALFEGLSVYNGYNYLGGEHNQVYNPYDIYCLSITIVNMKIIGGARVIRAF